MLLKLSIEQQNDFFDAVKTAHDTLSDSEFNEFMSYFLEAIIRRENSRLH